MVKGDEMEKRRGHTQGPRLPAARGGGEWRERPDIPIIHIRRNGSARSRWHLPQRTTTFADLARHHGQQVLCPPRPSCAR
jgi:hypothetical protein